MDSNLQPHLCTQKQEIKRQINKMQFCFFADQSEELILKLVTWIIQPMWHVNETYFL